MAIGEGTLSSSAHGWVDFGVLKLALCGCQFHEPLAKETPEVSEPKAYQVHFLSIPDFLSMLDRPPTITDHHRPSPTPSFKCLAQAPPGKFHLSKRKERVERMAKDARTQLRLCNICCEISC